MATWESLGTERARKHVGGLLSIAASKVRPAIEAREGITPFALALGLDEELTLIAPRGESADSLPDILAARAKQLWAGIILLGPEDQETVPALIFLGAHREAPPFKAVVPWSRASDGTVVWGKADMLAANFRLFG